jgi:hypothetical protein
MFQMPSNSNAFIRIAKWAAVALLTLSLLNAANMTRVELRCGAACQRIVSGREY